MWLMRKTLREQTGSKRSCRFLSVVLAILVCSAVFSSSVYAAPATQEMSAEQKNAASNEEVGNATASQGERVLMQSGSVDAKNQNRNGYDVVYVIDNSRSVWSLQEIRNQAFRNISNLAVGSNIRIGGVYFADHVVATQSMTSVDTREGAEGVLSFLTNENRSDENIDTNIGNALESAIDLFDSQDPSRQKILILFSDGINENGAGDSGYKKAADKKTAEQVKILKEMDVPIYCVYLIKNRNDEAYLKKLVNYFSEEDKYSTRRFAKVAKDDISSLSPTFLKIFYEMQGDMKYREVHLDSSGMTNFYVPSLGVKKLSIYLDGDVSDKATVYSNGDSAHDLWADGTASFFMYDDPEPGDWSIEVKDADPDTFYGTIAYYADLYAKIEMTGTADTGRPGEVMRAVSVRFYDKDGGQVSLDSRAEVYLSAAQKGEEPEKAGFEKEKLEIRDGRAICEKLPLDRYGEYDFTVDLLYEDFIDLTYTVPVSIENQPPDTFDQHGASYPAEREDGGQFLFSLEESTLFQDFEGEEVRIVHVTQNNSENLVEIEQNMNGTVLVRTQKSGALSFGLTVEDASGQSAEVTVDGTVRDLWMEKMQKILAVAAVLLLLLFLLLRKVLTDRRRKEYELLYKDVCKQHERGSGTAEGHLGKEGKVAEQRQLMDQYLYGIPEDKIPGIITFAEDLPEDLQIILGVREYMEEGFAEEVFSGSERASMALREIVAEMDVLRETTEAEHKEEKKISAKAVARMRQHRDAMKKICDEDLPKVLEKLAAESRHVDAVLEKMAANTIDEELTREIHCKLSVSNISCDPTARGMMSGEDWNHQYRRGFYTLDEVPMIGGRRRLRDVLGTDVRIYVSGYEEEVTGRDGLVLRSLEPVQYQIGSENNKSGELILPRGSSCKIWFSVEEQEVSTTIEVI